VPATLKAIGSAALQAAIMFFSYASSHLVVSGKLFPQMLGFILPHPVRKKIEWSITTIKTTDQFISLIIFHIAHLQCA
jgi:hypothetical protein